MAARSTAKEKMHGLARAGGAAFCGARLRAPTATDDRDLIDCVPCLCAIMEQCRAQIERLMDGPWSGTGKISNANRTAKRKLPREQMRWDE